MVVVVVVSHVPESRRNKFGKWPGRRVDGRRLRILAMAGLARWLAGLAGTAARCWRMGAQRDATPVSVPVRARRNQSQPVTARRCSPTARPVMSDVVKLWMQGPYFFLVFLSSWAGVERLRLNQLSAPCFVPFLRFLPFPCRPCSLCCPSGGALHSV